MHARQNKSDAAFQYINSSVDSGNQVQGNGEKRSHRCEMGIIKFAACWLMNYLWGAQLFAGRFCGAPGLIHQGGGDVRAAGHHRATPPSQMDCGKFKVARKLLCTSACDFSSRENVLQKQ
jgi:hypothetical protein